MTAHWEFTYGARRVQSAVEKELAPMEFLAQNVKTADFEDPVFKPYTLRSVNGVALAVIGQAFPYTPIANPRYMVAEWTFGIQEPRLQQLVDEVLANGAQVVVLLSHNGMDVDLKLAARVRGIDAILGGHTHDGVPAPVVVGGTLVMNSGTNGKFLSVLDLDVRVCETTLDQSNAPVAQRMKAFIRVRIAAGDTEQEIKDALVDEFGAGVLATPPKSGFGLLAWLLPLAALLGGAIAVGLLVRSWSRRRPPPESEEPPLDPQLERLVDEELARFDA